MNMYDVHVQYNVMLSPTSFWFNFFLLLWYLFGHSYFVGLVYSVGYIHSYMYIIHTLSLSHTHILTLLQNVFKKHGHKVDKDDKGFLWSLLNSSPPVVTEAYPLHNKNEIGKLSKMLHWSFVPFSGFDVNTIRNYFGMVQSSN